jgi:uncharacterized membrane protein YhaH (DUF805 family)
MDDWRNPWQLRGAIGRGPYLAWGLGLFALKVAIDALLVHWLFARGWQPSFYFAPLHWAEVYPADGPWQLLLFGAVSLPFLWVGVALTIRRLRDAGLAPLLVALFVLPVVNVAFFVLLALAVPMRESGPAVAGTHPTAAVRTNAADSGTWLREAIVANLMGILGLGASSAAAMALVRFYGSALFLGAPFLHGIFVGSWLGGLGWSRASSVLAAGAGVLCGTMLLLLFGFEGLGCIFMALPLLLPPAAIGAFVGHCLAASNPRARRAGRAALLLGPLLCLCERAVAPPSSVFEVATAAEIAAAPEQVWPHLVAFPPLLPPDEFVFRAGIAYPTAAHIDGEGPGAVRHCTFNTGAFVEPITVWDAPRRLAFDVTASPQPMIEWNPLHRDLDAPHLHGLFAARHGEFRLEPLPGGRTRLVGTTWYSHGLWPEGYWRLWSDWLVHRIHARVLEHVAAVSEGRR